MSFSSLASWASGWILDPFYLLVANAKLTRKLANFPNDPLFTDLSHLTGAELDTFIANEWTRAKELDGKLSALTAALSVGLTIGGAASTWLLKDPQTAPASVAPLVAFSIAILFFLMGSLLGFSGLRPKPRYGYGPTYVLATRRGDEARGERERASAGFLVSNLIRSNEISASIDLIRLGVLAYVTAIAMIFISSPVASRGVAAATNPGAVEKASAPNENSQPPALHPPAPVPVNPVTKTPAASVKSAEPEAKPLTANEKTPVQNPPKPNVPNQSESKDN